MRISDWSSDVCSSDLGDDSRKHSGLPGALVDLEPVAAKLACVGLPPAAVRFGECAEPDIAQRGQPAPDQDRRAIEQQPIDQIGGEKDRKSVGSGKSVAVRVDTGGRRIIKKKKKK